MVKERGILMGTPMVKALLAGEKTQTRRVISPRPIVGINGYLDWKDASMDPLAMATYCPYGKVGDRLWVRETWMDDCPGYVPEQLFYRADGIPECGEGGRVVWKPSIHMPRWASRLTLEITDVRVQRLQEITGEDARAEGVNCAQWDESDWIDSDGYPTNYHERQECAVEEFSELWDSINAKSHPWESNPWVWAISFEAVQA